MHTASTIAAEEARYGSLDLAIQAAEHDGASGVLTELLRERTRRQNAADPALHAARLRAGADTLDADAENLWKEAREFHKLARLRTAQGEHDLAATFTRRANAAEDLASRYQLSAMRLRSAAVAIEAGDNVVVLRFDALGRSQ